ncbi:phosphate ABC transporter substrate-binding protein PstS [Kamptonema sp. UHCC 0994]|uniref:phosphate ABC transporter substrate-binding protein PstS n=1 Tax=Kamptonema sp. UHCC 0994 TaxID=3031329 RepID=UPI0023BA3D55|nr:phosphate ABC transporter substrate-binding protein PstS [Kamptonema sp. UHCC 0994]MDF0551951.1 phosphate ABC transporter substrate-binding protein PstS [Kamptonema sp. UHCC 0994]
MLFRINLINPNRLGASISALALTASLAACGGGSTNNAATDNASPSASPVATSTNAANTKLALATDVGLTGAGASFPAPLYQRWFQDFNTANPKLQINYQSVGSGAGVEQFTKGTVDFGASDTAMKDEEIAKVPADKGVLLLPMSAGSIVIAYNLPDVTELKLPRDVYVDIFLGKITKWNDPKIVAANPGAKLPDQNITVVHRSDGSGTTGVFTKHLSAISPEWKEKVGEGKTVEWPSAGNVGGKGNEGVTASIQQTVGAIGYIEYGYAKSNNVKFAALQNKAGNFVVYNDEAGEKTLAAVTLPENLRAFIPDPEGADSYPIVSYTWMLIPKKVTDPNKAKAIEAMIEYGLNEGQKVSAELGYVPLPENVKEKVAAAADGISADYKIEVK